MAWFPMRIVDMSFSLLSMCFKEEKLDRNNLGNELDIRHYRPGDDERIVELLNIGFNGWPRFDLCCSPLEHWRWKYLDNQGGRCIIYVCTRGDNIIGVSHSITQKIKMIDDVHHSVYVCDAAVHPEFRSKGISIKLREAHMKKLAEDKVKYVYYVASNPIQIKSMQSHRPRFPHPIVNLVRIQDIDKQLRAMPVENPWLVKLGYRCVKLLNETGKIFSRFRQRPPISEIRRINDFDDRFENFWKQVSNQYDYIVERNRDYLNWRFCDPRAGDFAANVAEGDGEVKGYSVLRINRYREEYPIGFIVDMLVLSDEPNIVHSLISDAVNYFETEDVNIINYQVVKGHPYETIFKNHGFVDSRFKLQIFCNPYKIMDVFNKVKEIEPNKVYYSYGDIDSLPTDIPRYK